ncbi:unnamed protein product, partial [Timema podura]|nr:unnamed protein product [Timema podura]
MGKSPRPEDYLTHRTRTRYCSCKQPRESLTMSLEEEQLLVDTSDAGPGLEYMLYVTMEELHDKLNLLNYDVEFVRDLKMKPLSRLSLPV